MLTQKHKAYLIVFVTFLLGVLVGLSGQYLFAPASPPARTVAFVTAELTDTLHLDPDQRARVETILRESKQQYQALRDQMRPQMQEIRNTTRQRVRDLLLEDQKNRFDQYTRELDARRERERKATEENNK
jgi:hypothetical protein